MLSQLWEGHAVRRQHGTLRLYARHLARMLSFHKTAGTVFKLRALLNQSPPQLTWLVCLLCCCPQRTCWPTRTRSRSRTLVSHVRSGHGRPTRTTCPRDGALGRVALGEVCAGAGVVARWCCCWLCCGFGPYAHPTEHGIWVWLEHTTPQEFKVLFAVMLPQRPHAALNTTEWTPNCPGPRLQPCTFRQSLHAT